NAWMAPWKLKVSSAASKTTSPMTPTRLSTSTTPARANCAQIHPRSGIGQILLDRGQQIRSHAPGALDLAFASPGGDRGVVARQQYLGRLEPAPHGRLGVARVLEQAVFVALLDEALRIADDPRHEPAGGLDHRHRGDLAAVEHVVAET